MIRQIGTLWIITHRYRVGWEWGRESRGSLTCLNLGRFDICWLIDKRPDSRKALEETRR